jgi:hypothetical protein
MVRSAAASIGGAIAWALVNLGASKIISGEAMSDGPCWNCTYCYDREITSEPCFTCIRNLDANSEYETTPIPPGEVIYDE